MRYRKKPVVIEAIKFDGTTACRDLIIKELGFVGSSSNGDVCYDLSIKTLEGQMTARPGDYVIKGVAGEIYPCKPDIFEATYEEVKQ